MEHKIQNELKWETAGISEASSRLWQFKTRQMLRPWTRMEAVKERKELIFEPLDK